MEINGKIPHQEQEQSAVMPVLFIGGPMDGCRIEMESLPNQVQMPYTEMPTMNEKGELGEGAVPLLKKAAYRREAMRCPAGLYPLYVHASIPSVDIVHTLLEGYRESEEDRIRMAAMPG